MRRQHHSTYVRDKISIIKKGWKCEDMWNGLNTWFFHQNIFQRESVENRQWSFLCCLCWCWREPQRIIEGNFPAEFKIFENFPAASVFVCTHVWFTIKTIREYIALATYAMLDSLGKWDFRLHLHRTWKLKIFFPRFVNGNVIQFVTEINSESNHQYSMFASNVRSYNRKLTTLQRAARVEKIVSGISLWPQFCDRRRKIVCAVKGALFCLTWKVISERGKRGFCVGKIAVRYFCWKMTVKCWTVRIKWWNGRWRNFRLSS